ncbi:Ethionine resistance-conferring protein 1 [Cyberlindnera fabianii]|uniref:Ethionine resistance-conferring protein 1 n=1 Tax=Cyberlindnera fabianii TaxID=36022 RepID=A0A1V2L3M6_CYBFA|nr:Ethionine resistance-conferring protein 1 [Cyberlindnera fabianii]
MSWKENPLIQSPKSVTMGTRRNSTSSLNANTQLLSEESTYYGSVRSSRGRRSRFQRGLGVIEDENDDQISYDASIDTELNDEDEPKVTVEAEMKAIVASSIPLSLTFFFEYLLAVNSLFLIGRLGSDELAAASLAVMTFNVTGMAVFEGMSTCLDTFCSQAFGAGKYNRVGMYFQRCTAMITCISIPIFALWYWSAFFLNYIIPETHLLVMTQQYLRILVVGAPGLILFETGKRYLQSQKIFHASTYVLFFCLPFNIVLNYTLIGWLGFVGAPIAITITYWTMALLLLLYVVLIDGRECWPGFSLSKAFKKWGPMLNLAVPGLVMIESEYLSFEILTVFAAHLGTESLAAQAIVSNIGSLTYQLPFAVGCAISTRVAIYIGSGSIHSSKVAVRISFLVAAIVGTATCLIIIIFRRQFSLLFSSDEDVLAIAIKTMPIIAVNQLADTVNIIAAGILRSQGRQKVASYFNLACYYIVALPLAYLLAFELGLGLSGLWLGLGAGISLLALSESVMVVRSNWPQIMREAREREDEPEEVIIDDESTIASDGSAASSLYEEGI